MNTERADFSAWLSPKPAIFSHSAAKVIYGYYKGMLQDAFCSTINPACFYPGCSQRSALQGLRDQLSHPGGLLLLSGDKGCGKTLLLQKLLQEGLPKNIRVAELASSRQPDEEWLPLCLLAWGLSYRGLDRAQQQNKLEQYLQSLAAAGHDLLMVVDDAEQLSKASLQALIQLGNLRYEQKLMIKILLVGQAELSTSLQNMNQDLFSLPLLINAQLQPLDQMETQAYIRARLPAEAASAFTEQLINEIFNGTQGNPALINKIDRQLLILYQVSGRADLKIADVATIKDKLAVCKPGRKRISRSKKSTHRISDSAPELDALSHSLADLEQAISQFKPSHSPAPVNEQLGLDEDGFPQEPA
ncbi:MAG: AAA family ATPase [gamma proteobacterium symbiont of Bathyaustriella thionipta]|nr:AAA family ATPase [gamma proteobacterium symbiont of Bathyaustriella thionipta]